MCIRGDPFRCSRYVRFHPAAARSRRTAPAVSLGSARPIRCFQVACRLRLNPSVIRFRGEYLNLYSEYDGHTWHTALATSHDGIDGKSADVFFRPKAGKATTSPRTARPSRWMIEFSIGIRPAIHPRIALARSNDGRALDEGSEARAPSRPPRQFRRARRFRSLRHPRGRRVLSFLYRPRSCAPPAIRDRAIGRRCRTGGNSARIRFSKWAPAERSMKTAWANPPSGRAPAPGGCSTPAALGKRAAPHRTRQIHRRRPLGARRPRSSRSQATSPGIAKWCAIPRSK